MQFLQYRIVYVTKQANTTLNYRKTYCDRKTLDYTTLTIPIILPIRSTITEFARFYAPNDSWTALQVPSDVPATLPDRH